MREIKFRGKDVVTGKWVVGHYYEEAAPLQCIGEPEQGIPFIVFPGFADWNIPRPMYRSQVDPETVGQYTGLKDKNGKETYEDDIINIINEGIPYPANVTFEDGCFCVIGYQGDLRTYPISNYLTIGCELEVVGNDHDDPGLFGRLVMNEGEADEL